MEYYGILYNIIFHTYSKYDMENIGTKCSIIYYIIIFFNNIHIRIFQ